MTADNESLLNELKRLNLSLDEFTILQQMDISLDDIKKLHASVLWKTIQRKMAQRKAKAMVLYNSLVALKAKKYAGTPDDKITNPLATIGFGNKPLYTNVEEKRIAFELGVEDAMVAYTGFQEYIPLGGPGAEFNDVEYIAGLWRVQKKFPYEITNVRKKDFVLIKKLPHQERTNFEFYSAAAVVWGGTGCSADIAHPDWIVAKYKTPHGICWSYGRTIEEARAFMGIKLCDEYQDLIRGAALEKNNQK